MRIVRSKGFAVALLLMLGSTACADLDVTNVNEPDRSRAITSAEDVQSLISGGFAQWWITTGLFFPPDAAQHEQTFTGFLANQSFQMSSWPANEGMVFYSSYPRPAIPNQSLHQYFNNWAYTWTHQYQTVAGVNEGLRSLAEDPAIGESLGADNTSRARAFGKFVQGLVHGTIGLLYTQGYVVDETVEDPAELSGDDLVPYEQVVAASLDFFDAAIAEAEGKTWQIPASWMSQEVTADQLVQLAHSFKARYLAASARTPAEREALDWQAILDDVEAGMQEDWNIVVTSPFYPTTYGHELFYAAGLAGFQQMSYQILGMADQSGKYQEWLSVTPNDRHPDLESGPFYIVTPDERFPQGETREEQIANPGTHYYVAQNHLFQEWADFAWRNPSRGTYRWSYYRSAIHDEWILFQGGVGPVPEITMAEMDLLAAEAHLRLGAPGVAAGIINTYRTAAGLSETDAAGTNASCVPKLPDGTCGDLMEMLKWEKRLETDFRGIFGNTWYFDGRGWGDLYRCTQLEFPVPEEEALLAGIPVESTGGCQGESSSDGSVYDFPFEGGGA